MNSNIRKTLNFMKRNGLVKTVWAVKERALEKKTLSLYAYQPFSEEERLRQLERSIDFKMTFSILVPAYETPEPFLRGMIESVIAQTYPRWELVIADASSTDSVKKVVKSYEDIRIRCISLPENKGISENTNAGLKYCTGEYTGLLDHDDLLTKDALYEMAAAIRDAAKDDIKLQVLYSDEDKTNTENTTFEEPNIKPKFNLDLILSNNYICHFLVMDTGLMKELGFRAQFDGAQDHDLILRAVRALKKRYEGTYQKYIYHIPKVLYHWRIHDGSSAGNPRSKSYAYDAGQRAVEDFVKEEFGDSCSVRRTAHMGFYYVDYAPDIFSVRKDVCAVGGRILDRKKKVTGGAYDENGKLLFEGLSVHNSGGYLHRAACQMEVPYLDLSCMRFSPGIKERPKDESREEVFRFCEEMRKKGYQFVYDPEIVQIWK